MRTLVPLQKMAKIKQIIDIYNPEIVGLNETKRPIADSIDHDVSTHNNHFGNNCHIIKSHVAQKSKDPPISGTSVFLNQDKLPGTHGTIHNHEIIWTDFCLGNKFQYKCRLYQAYLSPSGKEKHTIKFFSDLINDINKLPNNTYVFLSGDLNALDNNIFPCRTGNHRGKILNKFLKGNRICKNGPKCKFTFVNNVNKATRVTKNTKTLIDFFISSANCKLSIHVDHLDNVSDHMALLVTIDDDPNKVFDYVNPQTLTNYRYDECNFSALSIDLHNLCNNLRNDIESPDIDLTKDYRLDLCKWQRIIEAKKHRISKYESRPNKRYSNKYFNDQKLNLLVSELEKNLISIYKKNVPHTDYEVEHLEDSHSIFPIFLKKQFLEKHRTFDNIIKRGKDPKKCNRYKALASKCDRDYKKFQEKWISTIIAPGRSSSREFYAKTKYMLQKSKCKSAVILKDEYGTIATPDKSADIISKHFSKKLNNNVKKNAVNFLGLIKILTLRCQNWNLPNLDVSQS